MRYRPGHLALLIFQAVWLNLILPGHTRGVVSLPGCASGASVKQGESAGCCTGPARHGPSDAPPKPTDSAARCAVCAFAARLTLPPVIDLTLAELGLLERLAPEQAANLISIKSIATYDGRAPPPLS